MAQNNGRTAFNKWQVLCSVSVEDQCLPSSIRHFWIGKIWRFGGWSDHWQSNTVPLCSIFLAWVRKPIEREPSSSRIEKFKWQAVIGDPLMHVWVWTSRNEVHVIIRVGTYHRICSCLYENEQLAAKRLRQQYECNNYHTSHTSFRQVNSNPHKLVCSASVSRPHHYCNYQSKYLFRTDTQLMYAYDCREKVFRAARSVCTDGRTLQFKSWLVIWRFESPFIEFKQTDVARS